VTLSDEDDLSSKLTPHFWRPPLFFWCAEQAAISLFPPYRTSLFLAPPCDRPPFSPFGPGDSSPLNIKRSSYRNDWVPDALPHSLFPPFLIDRFNPLFIGELQLFSSSTSRPTGRPFKLMAVTTILFMSEKRPEEGTDVPLPPSRD